MRLAGQTARGKAFEYACLQVLFDSLRNNQNITIEDTAAVSIARECYLRTPESVVKKMELAAQAAVSAILRLEPQFEHPHDNTPLFLSIQADMSGETGDVRDVLCVRKQNEWEIGFSCKHDHFAVKHSRLSNTIDFGSRWFSKPCSNLYFIEIAPLFAELRSLKAQGALWQELNNKEFRFYAPLLRAFVSELNRLDALYPDEIPPALITYLLGRNDFYKIIARNSTRTTEIQAFNLFGSLNRISGEVRPLFRIPQVKLPSRIFDVRFKENSSNTIIVTCDHGWAVSLRIHNASSIVEPSLKFDVTFPSLQKTGLRGSK